MIDFLYGWFGGMFVIFVVTVSYDIMKFIFKKIISLREITIKEEDIVEHIKEEYIPQKKEDPSRYRHLN